MFWPIVLIVAGYLTGFVPVAAGWPDVPWSLGDIAIAIGTVWLCAIARTRPRIITAAAFLVVNGLYAFWLFGLSDYEEPPAAPHDGELAPDIEAVRVRDGAKFTLSAQRGRDVLLVFFRGAW